MDDLVEFLHNIHLEHLAEIFKNEEISLDLLQKMTDNELKEIGITKFGNRKRILNAVQQNSDPQDIGTSKKYGQISDSNGYEVVGEISLERDEYSAGEDEEPLYENMDELAIEQSSIIGRCDQQVAVQTSNIVEQCRAEEIQASFFGKQDYIHSSNLYGTAFEQVEALFEGVSIKKQKAKNLFKKSYDEILVLLAKEEFFPQLRDELFKEYGDVRRYIKDGIKDLYDDSCPIVVTGETSAGKSSFVNLLLGVDILPQSSLSCTAAICRIHNSEEKKVTLTYKSGKQIKLDIEPNIEPAEMRKHLKQHVSAQSGHDATRRAMDGELLQFVDIWWPIKIIPKDLLIVDTPGVGPDDPHLTDKLYEYLPNALAFIYILNTPNAGGVQKDRILQVQEELAKHQSSDDMYFDTKRAIFICNKWDQIHGDEEEPEEVFNTIQQKLVEGWTGFDPNKLFKLSARLELTKCKEGKTISPEFKAVLNGIKEMIPATVEEKLKRHVKKQQGFLESIQKKLTARITTSMKSKDEKLSMITRIKERISIIESSSQMNKVSAIEKAKHECKDMVKRLHCQINDPDTTKKMFSWSPEDLPDGSNYSQILEEVDAIVKKTIANEIKNRIQNNETKRLQNFVWRLFRDECYSIAKEVNEMEGIIFGDDYGYVDSFNREDKNSNEFDLNLETREKVFLAITSPVLVPTALAVGAVVGILLLPVGAGYLLKDKVKNFKKLSKYRNNKPALAKKRAKLFLENNSVKVLEKNMEDSLMNDILEKINHFFSDVIPKRLSSAKALVTNIENDLRDPTVIRKASQKVESLVKPIYGQVLAATMEIFGEKMIKTSDVSNVHQKGDLVIARLSYKKSNILSVVKKCFYDEKSKAGWKYLAEIHAFRRCRHHNLLQVYGVCVPDIGDVRKEFYILQEIYEKDLTFEVIQNRGSWADNKRYLSDALEGLSYLHLSGMVHRNIRLETILITGSEGKLAELGDQSYGSTFVVKAPESLQRNEFGYESDIFQFGIVMWECWYNRRAYEDCENNGDVAKCIIRDERPKIEFPFPSEIETCIKRCWDHDPDKRPSAKTVQSALMTSLYMTAV